MERYCSNCGEVTFEEYYICTECHKTCTVNDGDFSSCCNAEVEEDNYSECCGCELQSEQPDLDEIAYERHLSALEDQYMEERYCRH